MQQMRLQGSSRATPQAVYKLLAEVQTHIVWNGQQQAKNFRLLTLDAPPGLRGAGDVFSSTGKIPMSSRIWRDVSTITRAEAPRVFEFRTESLVELAGGKCTEASFLHRYEIEPSQGGCSVTYTLRQLSLRNGMWRMTWPLLCQTMWRVGLPIMVRPGLRNLLRLAEEREAAGSS